MTSFSEQKALIQTQKKIFIFLVLHFDTLVSKIEKLEKKMKKHAAFQSNELRNSIDI